MIVIQKCKSQCFEASANSKKGHKPLSLQWFSEKLFYQNLLQKTIKWNKWLKKLTKVKNTVLENVSKYLWLVEKMLQL